MSRIVGPLHPGVARVLHIASLPDHAYPETLPAETLAAAEIGQTTLQRFVEERVAEHQLRGSARAAELRADE